METIAREKATNDPGSVGAPMSGVVVEVRVKEGHEIMKGDPLCGKAPLLPWRFCVDRYPSRVTSDERNEGERFFFPA